MIARTKPKKNRFFFFLLNDIQKEYSYFCAFYIDSATTDARGRLRRLCTFFFDFSFFFFFSDNTKCIRYAEHKHHYNNGCTRVNSFRAVVGL